MYSAKSFIYMYNSGLVAIGKQFIKQSYFDTELLSFSTMQDYFAGKKKMAINLKYIGIN